MPIYEYECAACGHRFEALQSAGATLLRKCPACARLRLARCTSAPSFHLKGGGWRKPAAKPAATRRRKVGHTLDSGPVHSHDHDPAPGPAPGIASGQGHAHGHGHAHGPGHKHHHH
jgi:putative FmdB family regulatory protein